MSAIVLLPVVISGASIAWPFVASAAVAAAASMGFAATKTKKIVAQGAKEVEFEMDSAEEGCQEMASGETLTFSKEGAQVSVVRNAEGRLAVKVSGQGKTDAQLKELGEQMAQRLVQQYAYHRLVTELKGKHFNVVDQDVQQDGTVRMRVRIYQG